LGIAPPNNHARRTQDAPPQADTGTHCPDDPALALVTRNDLDNVHAHAVLIRLSNRIIDLQSAGLDVLLKAPDSGCYLIGNSRVLCPQSFNRTTQLPNIKTYFYDQSL
jgi:hypothetical protein